MSAADGFSLPAVWQRQAAVLAERDATIESLTAERDEALARAATAEADTGEPQPASDPVPVPRPTSTLTPLEGAIEAVLIRDQDQPFYKVARRIAELIDAQPAGCLHPDTGPDASEIPLFMQCPECHLVYQPPNPSGVLLRKSIVVDGKWDLDAIADLLGVDRLLATGEGSE